MPLIAFLDRLGRTPLAVDYESCVAALDIDPATRAALVGRDPAALARAFGASPAYWCLIVAPEDEPKPAEDTPSDPPERVPEERPDPDPAD